MVEGRSDRKTRSTSFYRYYDVFYWRNDYDDMWEWRQQLLSLSLININGLADKRKIRGRKQVDDKKNMRLGENVWHQGVTGFWLTQRALTLHWMFDHGANPQQVVSQGQAWVTRVEQILPSTNTSRPHPRNSLRRLTMVLTPSSTPSSTLNSTHSSTHSSTLSSIPSSTPSSTHSSTHNSIHSSTIISIPSSKATRLMLCIIYLSGRTSRSACNRLRKKKQVNAVACHS